MMFLLEGKTFTGMICDVSHDVNSSRLYFGIIARNNLQLYNGGNSFLKTSRESRNEYCFFTLFAVLPLRFFALC